LHHVPMGGAKPRQNAKRIRKSVAARRTGKGK
jgi:hypothetical protein